MYATMLMLAVGAPTSDADARAALALAAANDPQPAHQHHAYEWKQSEYSPRYLLLYDGGKLTGCYNMQISNYWSWNAARNRYEELPSKPPTDLPPPGFFGAPHSSHAAPEPIYLQPFVSGPPALFYGGSGVYCPPGASS